MTRDIDYVVLTESSAPPCSLLDHDARADDIAELGE